MVTFQLATVIRGPTLPQTTQVGPYLGPSPGVQTPPPQTIPGVPGGPITTTGPALQPPAQTGPIYNTQALPPITTGPGVAGGPPQFAATGYPNTAPSPIVGTGFQGSGKDAFTTPTGFGDKVPLSFPPTPATGPGPLPPPKFGGLLPPPPLPSGVAPGFRNEFDRDSPHASNSFTT